jgi:hypothetical protein
MSNPDWANMKFNMNNSDDEDDDDEDEQRQQAEAAQRQAEAAQRQAEAARQNRLIEIQRKMFTDVGIDPNAQIDETGLEPDIQRELGEQQQERQRIQDLQRQATIANLLPGNKGRFTVDNQGIKYDRGKRMNGGKRRRKTRRRTRKSKKSKKSKKSRRYRK